MSAPANKFSTDYWMGVKATTNTTYDYKGKSTTKVSDNGTQTATIDGVALVATTGDAVSYSNTLFRWNGSKWVKIGELAPLVRQALSLAEYTNEATFKALFYLDKVTYRTDSNNKGIVIGMATGANLNRHAAKRYSFLRHMEKVNGVDTEYVIFNDSGLHVKAEAGVNSAIYAYSNYLKLDGYIFSAYYAKTTRVKISATKTHGGTTSTLFTDVVVATNTPAKARLDSTSFLVSEASSQALQGDRIDLTIVATNEEGDYTTTFPNITCAGMLDDVLVWKKVTAQNQNPSTGTSYAVIPTSEAINYIANTLLVGESGNPNYYKVNFAATTGYGQTPPIKGAQGTEFSESILNTLLAEGAYFAMIDGRDVILKCNSSGVIFGWCDSTYAPAPPRTILDDLSVVITAYGTPPDAVGNVVIDDMSVDVTNAGTESGDVDVTVVMTDCIPNKTVGDDTVTLAANSTETAIVLDSQKDEPIRYMSESLDPTAKVLLSTTINNNTITRVIHDISVTIQTQ